MEEGRGRARVLSQSWPSALVRSSSFMSPGPGPGPGMYHSGYSMKLPAQFSHGGQPCLSEKNDVS